MTLHEMLQTILRVIMFRKSELEHCGTSESRGTQKILVCRSIEYTINRATNSARSS